MRMREIIY